MEFDAVLLLSFGGPEGPEQVRPFLENVTRGRNVPPERLDAVAEHYLHFGGVSPINGINRALIAATAEQRRTCRCISATATGSPMSKTPLRPCATTAFVVPRCSPRRRGAATPAARNMSKISPGPDKRPGRTRPNWSSCGHTSTIRFSSRCSPDAVTAAAGTVPADARLVFTAHSVPVAADRRCGPNLYSRQVAYAARLVAAARRVRRLRRGVAVAFGPATGSVAGARCRRPSQDADRPQITMPSSSAPSGLSPTTSKWCGISTTSCARRPRRRAWRSPGPSRPTRIGDSPGWQ